RQHAHAGRARRLAAAQPPGARAEARADARAVTEGSQVAEGHARGRCRRAAATAADAAEPQAASSGGSLAFFELRRGWGRHWLRGRGFGGGRRRRVTAARGVRGDVAEVARGAQGLPARALWLGAVLGTRHGVALPRRGFVAAHRAF